ncbi:small integral membrane protein 30-like [Lampris incognitus]|uniref:small integral membrane protein 30-like n=1 Tax=Lampris incognitus TaxID=2546036 RepID=UPI0024B48EF5|nr:small integral membrane protein 30-like [Lampris incognitus]
MSLKLALPDVAAAWMVVLVCFVPPAEAYDFGDAVALLLGTAISIVGFCAFLGWYARRRNGHL